MASTWLTGPSSHTTHTSLNRRQGVLFLFVSDAMCNQVIKRRKSILMFFRLIRMVLHNGKRSIEKRTILVRTVSTFRTSWQFSGSTSRTLSILSDPSKPSSISHPFLKDVSPVGCSSTHCSYHSCLWVPVALFCLSQFLYCPLSPTCLSKLLL